jgi:hypothetical protein
MKPFHILLFLLAALLTSCDEDIKDMRHPCDFVLSVDEVTLDASSSGCADCFFKFSFRGRVYDFRDDRIIRGYNGFINNYYNDFFEFYLKQVQNSSDLFSSLNQQRALLTPDSLKKTDFNFLQPSFMLIDRCDRRYQVEKNTNIFVPDVSNNTITNISVWSYFVVPNGEDEPIIYSVTYLIKGQFTTRVLVGSDPEIVSGSYALQYTIDEPL